MGSALSRIGMALLILAAATALSVALFRNSAVGVMVDTALLVSFFYYLSTLRRPST